jgi:hypothetical protein
MTPPPTPNTTLPNAWPPAPDRALRRQALAPNAWPPAPDRALRRQALVRSACAHGVPTSASELLGARKRGGR